MHIVMARSDSENTLSDTVVSAPLSVRYLSTENRRLTVIPSTCNIQRSPSIRLRLESLGSESEVITRNNNDDTFTFLPPHLEPKIPKKQRQRAKKTIKHFAALAAKETDEEEKGCCERFNSCRTRKEEPLIDEDEEEIIPSSKLSPEMQKASRQGLSMIKEIVFPSLPALLQDLWVYLELAISIIAFAFGMIDIFPISDSAAYNYSYFILATVSMILALIDGFIYFFQLGSCARGIRVRREKLEERKQGGNKEEDEDDDDDEHDENEPNKCCRLSKKWKSTLNTWFELGRNLLTELILYPLLMFDLFDFIVDRGYITSDDQDRTDFSLFVIGGFYLILSVYIMRVFMVAGSMISLIRIPTNKAATGDSNDTALLIKFCAHVLGQIIVHLMVILVIGVKINNENPISTNSSSSSSDTNASPFLITSIVLGWIIPVAGVAAFFVVNYYWMKEFSISFWLNMISLLQGESFAEAVFGGEGLSATKEKALDFVEKTQYHKVKKQLKGFKATSVWTKFFFPLRVPVPALSGLLYDIALIAFIVCLMFTYKNGKVELVVFANDKLMTAVFLISITTIILANIHVLILLNLILFMVIILFALAAALAVLFSPLVLFVYFPIVAFLGYFMICYEAGSALKKKRRPKGAINLDEESESREQKGNNKSSRKLNNSNNNLDGTVFENTESISMKNIAEALEPGVVEESLDSKLESFA